MANRKYVALLTQGSLEHMVSSRALRGGFHNYRCLRCGGASGDADAHVWHARHGGQPWTSGSCA